MKIITTADAPQPAGHYSQAVLHRGVVYVAGQLPIDPAAPGDPPGDPASQARQALANVRAILEAAGSGLSEVLQMTIYLSDIGHWPIVNEVYAEMLGSHRPARAVVPCGELHGGYILEVQAIAAVDENEKGT